MAPGVNISTPAHTFPTYFPYRKIILPYNRASGLRALSHEGDGAGAGAYSRLDRLIRIDTAGAPPRPPIPSIAEGYPGNPKPQSIPRVTRVTTRRHPQD